MCVGGTFDFLAGETSRAPKLMQDLGIEWLYRLVNEPWRWKRMLALPRFACAVFFNSIHARI
jgi:N-acetylglucosaminyldiphosphoundecaprenol N-acetyl-beta-D-mannosaminyltransferase